MSVTRLFKKNLVFKKVREKMAEYGLICSPLFDGEVDMLSLTYFNTQHEVCEQFFSNCLFDIKGDC